MLAHTLGAHTRTEMQDKTSVDNINKIIDLFILKFMQSCNKQMLNTFIALILT